MQKKLQNLSKKQLKELCNSVCICDFTAPPNAIVRKPSFGTERARFYDGLDLSGPALIDMVNMELCYYHTGNLYDADGKLLAVRDDPLLTDNVFREDERRTALRFLERASRVFKYRLQQRMVPLMQQLYFAEKINICRTSGCCSKK